MNLSDAVSLGQDTKVGNVPVLEQPHTPETIQLALSGLVILGRIFGHGATSNNILRTSQQSIRDRST